MPDYLSLCAFRRELLPLDCRSCAWWQTTGSECLGREEAAERRRQWMTSLESSWGTTGLLLSGNGPAVGTPPGDPQTGLPPGITPAPPIAASINFAPVTAVPRLRDLPFDPLPAGSALLFCLKSEEGRARSQPRRVLHKALAQLKARGVDEAYAVAVSESKAEAKGACRYFSVDFLSANGFEQLTEDRGLVLMHVDLRGLLSLIGEVQTAVRRVLRNEPTPSPAAWTQRETS